MPAAVTAIREFKSPTLANNARMGHPAPGEVEGEYRWATIQVTIVSEAGIKRFPAVRINWALIDPYAGRPEQEVVGAVTKMIMDMKF